VINYYPRGGAGKLCQARAYVIGQVILGTASMLLVLSAAVREERGAFSHVGDASREQDCIMRYTTA